MNMLTITKNKERNQRKERKKHGLCAALQWLVQQFVG